jgi:hypothetical protein
MPGEKFELRRNFEGKLDCVSSENRRLIESIDLRIYTGISGLQNHAQASALDDPGLVWAANTGAPARMPQNHEQSLFQNFVPVHVQLTFKASDMHPFRKLANKIDRKPRPSLNDTVRNRAVYIPKSPSHLDHIWRRMYTNVFKQQTSQRNSHGDPKNKKNTYQRQTNKNTNSQQAAP